MCTCKLLAHGVCQHFKTSVSAILTVGHFSEKKNFSDLKKNSALHETSRSTLSLCILEDLKMKGKTYGSIILSYILHCWSKTSSVIQCILVTRSLVILLLSATITICSA